MYILPKSLRKLIEELNRLPGIGHKTASRLAFFLLRASPADRSQLAGALSDLSAGVRFCQRCHNLAERELCGICADRSRDENLICVVEEPLDVVALEQGHSFGGVYHVLGGVISPIDGVGPEHLQIASLLARVKNSADQKIEVVIATNPSLEGESTARYVARELKKIPGIKITRIAHGLPIGGDIEYADELTIAKALEGRRDYG